MATEQEQAELAELAELEELAALEAMESQAAPAPQPGFLQGAYDAVMAPVSLASMVGQGAYDLGTWVGDSIQTGDFSVDTTNLPDLSNPDTRDAIIRTGADVAGAAGGAAAGLAASPFTFGTSAVVGPAAGPVLTESALEMMGLLNPTSTGYKLGNMAGDIATAGLGRVANNITQPVATRFGDTPDLKKIEKLSVNPNAISERMGIAPSSATKNAAAEGLNEGSEYAARQGFFDGGSQSIYDWKTKAKGEIDNATQQMDDSLVAVDNALRERGVSGVGLSNATIDKNRILQSPEIVGIQQKIAAKKASTDANIVQSGIELEQELNKALAGLMVDGSAQATIGGNKLSKTATLEGLKADVVETNARLRARGTYDPQAIANKDITRSQFDAMNEVDDAIAGAKRTVLASELEAIDPAAAAQFKSANEAYGQFKNLTMGLEVGIDTRSAAAANTISGIGRAEATGGQGGLQFNKAGVFDRLTSPLGKVYDWVTGSDKQTRVALGLEKKTQEAADFMQKMARYKAGRLQNQPNKAISTAGNNIEFASMAAAVVPNTLSLEMIRETAQPTAEYLFQQASQPGPGESPELAQQRAAGLAQDFLTTMEKGTDKEQIAMVAQLQAMGLIEQSAIKGSVSRNGITFIPLPADRQKFVEDRKSDLSNGTMSKAEYYAQLNAMSDPANGKVIESAEKQKANQLVETVSQVPTQQNQMVQTQQQIPQVNRNIFP
jgi:hypothetical protein